MPKTVKKNPSNGNTEIVILLHGFGRTKSVMSNIETALSSRGLSVLNWNYNSITKSVTEIAEDLNDVLLNMAKEYSQFSFVTHSLGGIVLRRMIKLYPIHNIRKIVMITPPNQGASLARVASGILKLIGCIPLKPIKIISKGALSLTPPAIKELMDESYLTENCAVPDCKYIIIAGRKGEKKVPLSFVRDICLGIPNDGTVTVEETKLPHCEKHFIVNESHSSILSSKAVINKIVHYLNQS